jgi:dTDP-L-rhamnose 4-epimerase
MVLKVLVTGGAGFIGSALTTSVRSLADVTVVDSLDPQIHPLQTFSRPLVDSARCIRADVRDENDYADIVSESDVVVHLASETGTGQSMYEISRYVSANTVGTAKLLETISAARKPPKRVILASSRAVYGDGVYRSNGSLRAVRRRVDKLLQGQWEPTDDDGQIVKPLPMSESHPLYPTSIYGMTKLWQEQLVETVCRNRGIDYAILRFQNVFGPGQTSFNPYAGIVAIITQMMAAGEVVEIFEDGRPTRDFIFIDDAVAALREIIFAEEAVATTMNVGTGVPVSLLTLAEVIARCLEMPAQIRTSGLFRLGDIRHAVADPTRFRSRLPHLAPTPIEKGMARYVDWFRSHPPTARHRLAASLSEMQEKGVLLQAAVSSTRSGGKYDRSKDSSWSASA